MQRVSGWAVEGMFESSGGQAVEVAEMDLGMRKLYRTLPGGLVIR